jgi:hypothetical protein
MTVSELLKILKKSPPHHVVQVWNTHQQHFEGQVNLQVNHTSDELQITLGEAKSSQAGHPQLPFNWTSPPLPPRADL